MLIDRRQERVCVALKSPREGSTDRLRRLPRRLFEAQGGVVLPTWRAARTGFVISHALGLGCRRREAHDPTLLTLYGVKYGVKIPHFVGVCARGPHPHRRTPGVPGAPTKVPSLRIEVAKRSDENACASPSKAPGRVRPIACAACRAASSRRRVTLFFRPGGRPGPDL